MFSRPFVAKMRKLSYKSLLFIILDCHTQLLPQKLFLRSPPEHPPIIISSFEEAVCIVAKCWWQISIPPAWLDIYPLFKTNDAATAYTKTHPFDAGILFCAPKRKGNRKNLTSLPMNLLKGGWHLIWLLLLYPTKRFREWSRWSFTPMINQFSFTKLNPNDIGLIHSFHSWRKCTIN